MTDNELVRRIYAAVEADGGNLAEPEIGCWLDHGKGEVVWQVCYRNSGDWKNNVYESTLRRALTGWLKEYEAHLLSRPYASI